MSASYPGSRVSDGGRADDANSTDSGSVLSINADLVGRIEGETDSDWHQLTVAENDSITVSVLGTETGDGSLTDPILVLRDEDGAFVQQVVAGAGRNAELTI